MPEVPESQQAHERLRQDAAIQIILTVLVPAAFVLSLALFGQLGDLGFTTPFDGELTEAILNW